MNISQELTLNLSADGIPPRLHMVQGDANTRTVVATLWDGAQPYTVPAASAVMIRFRKPDGTGGLYDTTESGAQVTVSGNTVTAPVATQMLAVAGVVQAQVDIYGTATGKAAEKLATFRFAVEVAPSVYPDAEIISSDYFNIIAADISKAVEAAARAEAAQAAASAAQQGAESARDDAVNAKTTAESAKTAAVAAQKKSEEAQTKAETAQTAAEQSAAAAQTAKEGAETAQSGAQAAQSAAESAKAAAQTAQTSAESARAGAEAAKSAAEDSAEDAEAWAVGQRNGADVPSTDPAYHNNAKYYKDQAQTIAGGEFVSYGTPQSLTPEQQAQARDNIGAPAPYEAGDNISITGRIITTKAFPCNPKLTDNWYFGNPVDQRGGYISLQGVPVYNDAACTSLIGNQTEAAATCVKSGTNYQRIINGQGGGYVKAADVVRGYTGAGYGIDRWRIDDSGGLSSLLVNSDGTITISNGAAQNPIWFTQILEHIIPETKTASALVTGITGTANMYSGTTTGMSLSLNLNTMQSSEESNIAMRFVVFPNSSVTIKAVKLEPGPQQTLVHKEYGEWVLNEIPKYGDQLAECQRYLFAARAPSEFACIGSGYISADGAEAIIVVPTPVSLRTSPVCTVNGTLRVDTSYGEIVTVNNVSAFNAGNGSVCIHGAITGMATPKAPCYMLVYGSSNLLLSAEL